MLVQPSGRFVVAALDQPLTSRPFFSSHWSAATASGRTSVSAVIPLVCGCCVCTSRAQRLRRRSQGGSEQSTKGFFDDWARWVEDDFVAKLDLVEETLPSEFARRIGSLPSSSKSAESSREEAIIESRVWLGQAPDTPVRRVRYVVVDAGPQLQAFNAVVYPAPSHGLQPVLGVDVLSFNSHKRQLFGVDWAPMLPESGHIEERIAPFVRSIYDDFEAFRSAPGGKVYGESPEFFSPYMFFSRPEGPEAISAGSELWRVFTRYFDAYRAVLSDSPVVDEVRSVQAQERQDAYDTWHAERDPALKVFAKMFGEEWTEEFSGTVLFPGSRLAGAWIVGGAAVWMKVKAQWKLLRVLRGSLLMVHRHLVKPSLSRRKIRFPARGEALLTSTAETKFVACCMVLLQGL
ncbi:pebA [Symbiodinium sp. CCMP2456]|nr:pebA [Symbiodinium sp. CCMP2456]